MQPVPEYPEQHKQPRPYFQLQCHYEQFSEISDSLARAMVFTVGFREKFKAPLRDDSKHVHNERISVV